MGGSCGRGRVLGRGPRRVAYSVMARFLCALRSLPFREVPGWGLRGRAGRGGLGASTGPGDAGRTRASQAPPPPPGFRFPFTCQDLGARLLVLDLALTFSGSSFGTPLPAHLPPSATAGCKLAGAGSGGGGEVTDPCKDLCKGIGPLSKRAHTSFFFFCIKCYALEPGLKVLGQQPTPRALCCSGPCSVILSPFSSYVCCFSRLRSRRFRLCMPVDLLPDLLYFCVSRTQGNVWTNNPHLL